MPSSPGPPRDSRRPGRLEVVRTVLQAAQTVLLLLRLIGGGC
jgi:hypothetical protein